MKWKDAKCFRFVSVLIIHHMGSCFRWHSKNTYPMHQGHYILCELLNAALNHFGRNFMFYSWTYFRHKRQNLEKYDCYFWKLSFFSYELYPYFFVKVERVN